MNTEIDTTKKHQSQEEVFNAAMQEIAAADKDKMDTITFTAGIRHKKLAKPPHLIIPFFNENHVIRLDTHELFLPKGKEMAEIPMEEKLLIMHYILHAESVALSGQMVSFKETPDGMFYYPKFVERVEAPIIEAFGDDPGLLLKLVDRFDARLLDTGDAGISFFALPYIHMGLIVWGRDEEFPPSAQFLFDRTITEYLSTEGIIILCELAVKRLVQAAKEEE